MPSITGLQFIIPLISPASQTSDLMSVFHETLPSLLLPGASTYFKHKFWQNPTDCLMGFVLRTWHWIDWLILMWFRREWGELKGEYVTPDSHVNWPNHHCVYLLLFTGRVCNSNPIQFFVKFSELLLMLSVQWALSKTPGVHTHSWLCVCSLFQQFQHFLQEHWKEGCNLIGYWTQISSLLPESQTLPLIILERPPLCSTVEGH